MNTHSTEIHRHIHQQQTLAQRARPHTPEWADDAEDVDHISTIWVCLFTANHQLELGPMIVDQQAHARCKFKAGLIVDPSPGQERIRTTDS